MHPEAVGWDWIGMNLDGGGALTAFRLRRQDGSALWASGSFRAGANATLQVFEQAEAMAFTPLRHWTSPRTGTRYPVAWRIDTPAGRFGVDALADDQELDSRGSTGAIYWEGPERAARRFRQRGGPRLPRTDGVRRRAATVMPGPLGQSSASPVQDV